MKPKVFIVEKSTKYNVAAAESFGTIVYLSDKALHPFDVDMNVKVIAEALELHRYDSEVDYICFTGNSILLGLLMGVVMCQTEEAKVLLFDARESRYKERLFKDPSPVDSGRKA